MPLLLEKLALDNPNLNTRILITIIQQATTTAWTDMPAAVTELRGVATYRRKIDLRPFKQFRVGVASFGVAGLAGAKIGLQYSIDAGTTWKGLDNGTINAQSTTALAIDAGANTTIGPTAWATINTEARIDDCLVRVVGSDGDGVVDPTFNQIMYELG